VNLREQYLDQPHEISIETLALCNAACTFCPYPTLERKGTKMSDELIDRLIGEMATFKTPFSFSPFKVNEPLLDRRLIPICQKFNREVPLGWLRIFTNGQALTPDKIEQIAGLQRVHHLWISLNSHIPEEYEKLMSLKFDITVKRLDYLHSIEFPHEVMLSTVGFPNEPFRRYCFDRWPKFRSMAIKRDAWIDYTNAQEFEIPDAPCGRWFELSIIATGKVSHCCMDGLAAYPIGDVNENTMLEIYNAPFWRERREKMISRRQLDDSSPCSRCSY
jgi:radical SAM family protein/iron-sulfur cluster protein